MIYLSCKEAKVSILKNLPTVEHFQEKEATVAVDLKKDTLKRKETIIGP